MMINQQQVHPENPRAAARARQVRVFAALKLVLFVRYYIRIPVTSESKNRFEISCRSTMAARPAVSPSPLPITFLRLLHTEID
jgi:hypothetical protein